MFMSLHKKTSRNLFFLAILAISSTSSAPAQAPSTRVDNFREVIHGVEIVDPYRWLEDQDGPETRAWIDAQNKYTHSLLDSLPSRPLIQKRLSELLRVDTVGTPLEEGGRYFLFKLASPFALRVDRLQTIRRSVRRCR